MRPEIVQVGNSDHAQDDGNSSPLLFRNVDEHTRQQHFEHDIVDGPPRGRPVERRVQKPHTLVHGRRVELAPVHEQVHGDGERERDGESKQHEKYERRKGAPFVALADDAVLRYPGTEID